MKELKVLNQENIKAVKNNRIQVGYLSRQPRILQTSAIKAQLGKRVSLCAETAFQRFGSEFGAKIRREIFKYLRRQN